MGITASRLREVLNYDPLTGDFTWKARVSIRVAVGKVAGSRHGGGYIEIGIDGASYLAHRLAVLFVTGEWPASEVDHRNGNRRDNSWLNLRVSTHADNSKNMKRHSDNAAGFKGVFFDKQRKKFAATITTNGKRTHLGFYPTPQDAHSAYCIAAAANHGQHARFS